MNNLHAEQFTKSKIMLLTASLQSDLDRIERELQTRKLMFNQYSFSKEKENLSQAAELAAALRAKLTAIDTESGAAGEYFTTDC
ncbi:hypothetical protein KEH56_03480 [Burkholderia cenocepacia]|uniref:hypothetical protein n=1 Tax=Burkholderia cenocepacia TaxID=95486 RepID=UPI001BA61C08|nr:hypothetical protein [Burkholderia cenocepacia]QUN39965.1 hypothetical protein KEH56_03480 [Burkholderia cenocepacia]QUO23897.1 hypothetical protein KEH57_09900 [Burkholderia cenocepacia]QUO28133.1 hypothetical protein KEH57_30505 [Burkholderia cenocepacia]QUO28774.1 hypothetical protein KEH57_33975 [Burkholderia cenocepacia]